MAIRIKSLDEMIRDVIASLKAGEPGRPVFSLLLGSGFSVPIIPTPSQMVKGDIAWWRYWKSRKLAQSFCNRAEAIAAGLAAQDQLADFERDLWKPIHAKAMANPETEFPLSDGLPDLNNPNAVGRAYQAVMAEGLISNRMRRQYLRDAIARTHPRVNAAHIFLAGILEAQETADWQRDWGAPFCRTIFTTNFDPLLQRSLQLVNKLYYMSDRPDVLEPPDDDESEAIHLVYTHGSVHRYDLLNTEDQIKHARERNAPSLIDYFQHHGVIVIGYSGWFDTTMEALSRCPWFDSNLYWCDIHPAGDAEHRLRREVLEILGKGERHAYYVPIPGADEAMRLLHRELNLGAVPKFILDPVGTVIAQLESIEVPRDPAVPAATASGSDVTLATLADLRDKTLNRLRIAKSAFDDPAIVQPKTLEGKQDVGEAIAAQLFSNAFVAYSQGKREHAIDLWTAIIDAPGISAEDRAKALNNRGVVRREKGELEKAIADYTTVIEMEHAPADEEAIALVSRGFLFGEHSQIEKEIADYTAVIGMVDAPAEQKAIAFYNRGVAFRDRAELAKAIVDYTAVIDMSDAPSVHKAMALRNRGLVWRDLGETAKALTDYTSVIAMAKAPADQKAKALNNRGDLLAKEGEANRSIADFKAVIEMADAPIDQKSIAYANRGWHRFAHLGDVQGLIDDSRDALALEGDITARSNLALGLLLAGDVESARAEYEQILSMTPTAQQVKAAITDIENALPKYPDVAGAKPILERLRNAIPAPN